MPSFDIIRKTDVDRTFRVASVMSDFDIRPEQCAEHFKGELNLPNDWHIGIIYGGSGTGKTTIARELFGDDVITHFEYTAKSVIDDMPKSCSTTEIEQMFYAVGFGSVPSWLKPYSVLSNGEKMRVDLARALLERPFVVFDEFTSVVDRNVAKTASIAVAKAIRRTGKKFIAVSCHKDIIQYLQPDWQFCTDDMSWSFTTAHDQKKSSPSEVVGLSNGGNLGDIII